VSTTGGWPPAPRPRRRRRRRRLLQWAGIILVLAVVFAAGLALGQALDDNPDPATSPSETIVRTLGPLPLRAPSTVTVTVTRP
jgi:ferric-dicitrate binding protein FerR (iron transport regulator)